MQTLSGGQCRKAGETVREGIGEEGEMGRRCVFPHAAHNEQQRLQERMAGVGQIAQEKKK